MRKYKVFLHPAGWYEVIKQGWCWPAFFFDFIWAIIKLWWPAVVGLFIFYTLLALIQFASSVIVQCIVALAYFFIKAVFAHDAYLWRERDLSKRGYEYLQIIDADNRHAALAKYLKKQF